MGRIDCRVINLDRRADRLADIGTRLDAAGIAWTRHVACDASDHGPEALRARVPGASRAYPMAHVERACAISHLTCWQEFLRGDGQVLCVLEDDVQFSPELALLLASDDWVTPAHGVVKLDANSPKRRKSLVSNAKVPFNLSGHTLWRMWSRRLGGGGYLAHRDIVKSLLRRQEAPNVPIDHCLFNPAYAPQFRETGVHIVEPPVVFHDHTGSDMQAARRGQKRQPGWLTQKLAREIVGLSAIPARLLAMLRFGARFRDFGP